MSGSFPPAAPTSLQRTLPSYLFQEYADDDNLQAFVDAYNGLAQQYVDWFNSINLPVYTGLQISGALLDWVGAGLYGIARPFLPSGSTRVVGPFNTYALNGLRFDVRKTLGSRSYFATDDDVYKRIMTWHFFKGDGRVFNIRWLKRRIMRFLEGANGANYPVAQTYQISVTFGVGNQVNIRVLEGMRAFRSGATFNSFLLNRMPFDRLTTVYRGLPSFALAPILKAALDAGILELPFQFTYVVQI